MAKAPELVYEDDGEVKALVAAEVTLYLTNKPALEAGLVEAYRRALPHLAGHLTWYRTERMRQPKKVTPAALDAFPNWFGPNPTRREQYELVLTSGRSPDDVGPWGFAFELEPRALAERAGFFQFTLPADILRDRPAEFAALVRSLAEALPFRSGHAGYGLQYDEGDLDEDRDAQMKAWCNRYPGLDCRDLASECEPLVEAIKTVSWLTLIDQELCERVGGADALREQLPAEVGVEVLPHGVMIQAGPKPLLGDRNRPDELALYRQVDAALRPIRLAGGLSLSIYDDEDDTTEWLQRFEQP